jgi:hypothetical protein
LTQMKELMENSAKEAAAYKDEIDQVFWMSWNYIVWSRH